MRIKYQPTVPNFLDSSLQWKLLNEITGTINISLPDNFNEVTICSNYTNSCLVLNIPYKYLTNTYYFFTVGSATSEYDRVRMAITINKNEIASFQFYNVGNDVTSSTKFTVYYR